MADAAALHVLLPRWPRVFSTKFAIGGGGGGGHPHSADAACVRCTHKKVGVTVYQNYYYYYYHYSRASIRSFLF